MLLVGLKAETIARLEPLLQRGSFAVDRMPQPEAAIALLELVGFDTIVVGYPLAGASLTAVLDAVRREGSPCQHSVVLVLAPPDSLAEVAPLGEARHVRVASTAAADNELHDLVASLLRVTPRLSVRINIRLEVEFEDGRRTAMSQTENLSTSGMLVRCRRPYPVDSVLRFELLIPGESTSVAGTGTVVRHTQERRDGQIGVGIRFEELNGEGPERLRQFLEPLINRQGGVLGEHR